MKLDEAISQINTLWPYLNYTEKLVWVKRFMPEFNNDFTKTIEVLSGVDWKEV